MKRKTLAIGILSGFLITASTGLWAAKPESPGKSGEHNNKDKHHGEERSYHNGGYSGGYSGGGYFTSDRSSVIRSFYQNSSRPNGCPPGLAKKNNGCQPPGQAKQWRVGSPLPPDLVYYDVPGALLHELGRTPEGQKIVRVGTDLLLISVGTGMVLDAIEDLDNVF